MGEYAPCVKKTLDMEGRPGDDYSVDPKDRGGETYRGIARKFWPTWSGWERIDNYKKMYGDHLIKFISTPEARAALAPDVYDFYKIEFFGRLSLANVHDQEITEEIFDTAVNCGSGTAGKMLQRALNYLNDNGAIFADLVEDGAIGPGTLAAITKVMTRPGGREGLLKALRGEQYAHYKGIVQADKGQERFFLGWLRRV